MKPQAITNDVLREKYARPGEADADAIRRRVARALANGETCPPEWEGRFLAVQRRGFIPAGRINAAAGTALEATLINCFVQPVGDSISGIEDGRPGIYPALQQAAETLRRGGGVGYDFSAIRPNGALVHSTQSRASGPVSYMRLFDRSCETLESAGARRGAQMGVLRVEHPDIEAFIAAKDQPGELTNFNISVAASDDFMQAVAEDRVIELVHAAEPSCEQRTGASCRRADGLWVYRRVPARRLFEQITARSWHHGDPGMLFIDTAKRENNLREIEEIVATNPCAEQPLPAYGCCCLGSIDLTRFVRGPFAENAHFDFAGFAALVPDAVRMLDRVLDLTFWPLAEQAREARAKRRIGLGITGLGDCLIMLGQRYDSEEARATAAEIGRCLRDTAYRASVELAREKGPFPLFDAARMRRSPFIERLPEGLREAILAHGLRNSHLLSIAPTGTISLAFADNVSNGIEPPYAWRYERKRRLANGESRTYRVEDHAYRLFCARFGTEAPLPDAFLSALEIGVGEQMAMVARLAPLIDAGISKTVNVPSGYPLGAFRDLYLDAWRRGLKALSTFRPSSGREGILSAAAAAGDAEGAAAGEPCPACGNRGFRRFDGCWYCSACGFHRECD